MPFKPNSFFKFNVNHYDFFINLRDLHKIFYTLQDTAFECTIENGAAHIAASDNSDFFVIIIIPPSLVMRCFRADIYKVYSMQ